MSQENQKTNEYLGEGDDDFEGGLQVIDVPNIILIEWNERMSDTMRQTDYLWTHLLLSSYLGAKVPFVNSVITEV